MSGLLSQLPQLPPGAIESWLLAAAAVALIAGAFLKLLPRRTAAAAEEFVSREEFRLFRAAVERDLGGLRDRIDSRHLNVIEAIDKLRADLLKDEHERQARLSAIEAALARLDERTK